MSETRGRGRSKGSLDALARARARRSLEARTGQPAPSRKPTKPKPHLQPFRTARHLAKMRQAKAEKRQERLATAETLRRAQEAAAALQEREAALQAAQTEAERLRLVRAEQEHQRQQAEERERHRTRPITILTASAWLGEDPRQTLKRWPSSSIRASDVAALIQEDGKRGIYYTPCGLSTWKEFSLPDAAAILGAPAPEPPEPVTATRQISALCPRKHDTPSVLVWKQRDAYSNEFLKCPECGYGAVFLCGIGGNRTWIAAPAWLSTPSAETWMPPITSESFTYTPKPPVVTIDEAAAILGVELPTYEPPHFEYPVPPPPPSTAERIEEFHAATAAIKTRWSGCGAVGSGYRTRFEYLLDHGA